VEGSRKNHGTFDQFGRDIAERRQSGREKDGAFMVRCPGRRMTSAQWLLLEDVAATTPMEPCG